MNANPAQFRVLTLNCGTSTLRFDVVETDHGYGIPILLASGFVESIGGDAEATLTLGHKSSKRRVKAGNHAEAFEAASQVLSEAGLLEGVEAVGHRIVHGGPNLLGPAVIDDRVLAAIEDARQFAPLHNGAALEVATLSRARLPNLPQVAAFDTDFFVGLPEVARRYALPNHLSERLGIRRFGFQGLAHHYMVEHYRALHSNLKQFRLITLQLGSDCSVTASIDGMPVDTSMGATLLEGLIMETRSGDLDPAIPIWLITRGGMQAEEAWRLLNTQSGLKALSGEAADFRALLRLRNAGDREAEFAFQSFCVRVRKYIGAYLAVLGGTNAIIFGGGIGQHSHEVRSAVCGNLEWAGVKLDERWNQQATDEMIISPDDSPTEVWVMNVNEAAVIAQEVRNVLSVASRASGSPPVVRLFKSGVPWE
jgi:acetate kinase